MTESDWLSCHDPRPMLEWLHASRQTSERKLRLFGCACYRRIWHLVTDERSQKAVEVGERFADGLATKEELASARNKARAAPLAVAWAAASAKGRSAAEGSAEDTGRLLAGAAMQAADAGSQATARAAGWAEAHRMQADLLRDIFGFRPGSVSPSVLAWKEGTVQRLATVIYEDRCLPEGTLDASRLAILADALEEAGCCEEAILSHCRTRSDHVRGCSVIDLLLGRE